MDIIHIILNRVLDVLETVKDMHYVHTKTIFISNTQPFAD